MSLLCFILDNHNLLHRMDNYRPMQKNMAEWRTPQMVHFIGSGIPDLVVGLIIFCIVISGALRILKLSK